MNEVLDRLPGVLLRTITFPFYKVLQLPIANATVKDDLYLILHVSVGGYVWRRMVGFWSFGDRVRRPAAKKRDVEDGVNSAKGAGKLESICITVDHLLDWKGTEPPIIEFLRRSLCLDVPCVKPYLVTDLELFALLPICIIIPCHVIRRLLQRRLCLQDGARHAVCKFGKRKPLRPVILTLVAEHAEVLLNLHIHPFRLSVCLRVEGG